MKSRKTKKTSIITRRQFLKSSAVAATGTILLGPTIVPSSVFGANAPSERITFGCIGVGRMGLGDLREILGFKQARVIAVCDVDSKRVEYARQLVEKRFQLPRLTSGMRCPLLPPPRPARIFFCKSR